MIFPPSQQFAARLASDERQASGGHVLPTTDYRLPTLLPLTLAIAAVVALLGLPFPANVIVVAAFAAGFLAASPRHAPLALGAIAFSVPLNDAVEGDLGGTGFELIEGLIYGTLIGWGLAALVRREPLRGSPILVAVLALLGAIVLSVARAGNRSAWEREAELWLLAALVLVAALAIVRTRRDVVPVVAGLALAALGNGLHAVWQVVADTGPESFRVGGVIRAYGAIGHPNTFAGYLGITVPLLVAVAGTGLVERVRDRSLVRLPLIAGWLLGLAIAGAAGGGVALLLTQSRGGWLGAAAGLALVGWLLGREVRIAMLVAGVAAVVVVALSPLGERVALRLGPDALAAGGWTEPVQVTPENWAVQERLAHWRAGVSMAREYPVSGVGAGNFPEHFREHTPVWRFRVPRGHAHNVFIDAAAETGLVGLAALAGLVATVGARLAWLLRRAEPGLTRAVVVGAIGVSVAALGHGQFANIFAAEFPIQLAIVWAVAEVAGRGIIRRSGGRTIAQGSGHR